MNITKINKALVPALTAGLGLMLVGHAEAQSLTTLHSFTGVSGGANPFAGLVLSDNTLYGTAYAGGTSGNGTVFAVNTDGTGFKTLHNFTATKGTSGSSGTGANSDGIYPRSQLILSGNILYGTAIEGGTSGNGTVFAVNTDGAGFTTLYNFSAISKSGGTFGDGVNNDGALPSSGLVLSGDALYGTATSGGSSDDGTVFAVSTNGADFVALYSFIYGDDGALSEAGLILSGDTLYGTAARGGSSTFGTVFAVNTDGSGFTTLHSFTDRTGTLETNGDGVVPDSRLVLSGGTLYGTASLGGESGHGTVFAVNTDGTGFATLHSFSLGAGSPLALPTITNSDGAYPWTGLVLSGNTLYGTTVYGGAFSHGTIFAVNTDGTGFTTLYNFTGGNDGAKPWGGLILSGDTLYGTTELGGSAGYGTVYSISLSPQFSLSVPPISMTVNPGGATTCEVTIGSFGGFAGDVTLSASGLPVGATASFSASSVSAPGAANLTITTASTTAPGSYALTITGTSGSLVEHATATLVVAAPNFSISVSPTVQSVKPGGSTTYAATVTACGGFDGAVSFSTSGLPSGATASFSPSSVSGSGSSTLTVATKSTTRPGSTSFTITGTGPSGSPMHSTTVTLTVKN